MTGLIIMDDTIQTCPRRMAEYGPWDHKELLDRWRADGWFLDPDEAAKHHAEQDARLVPGIVHRAANADLWLWDWGPPRTCSFCGGIHPDDALRLLKEGWELSRAKSYKAYLGPPGTRIRDGAFLASIQDSDRQPGQGVPSIWSPTPPVKLYTHHFTDAQITEINALAKLGGR